MKKVKVGNKEFRTQYRHVNIQAAEDKVMSGETRDILDLVEDRLLDTFKAAYKAGQIGIHELDGYVSRVNVINKFNGATVCYLEDDECQVVSVGYSFCSANDQFSKQTGRNVALGRAVQELKRKVEV